MFIAISIILVLIIRLYFIRNFRLIRDIGQLELIQIALCSLTGLPIKIYTLVYLQPRYIQPGLYEPYSAIKGIIIGNIGASVGIEGILAGILIIIGASVIFINYYSNVFNVRTRLYYRVYNFLYLQYFIFNGNYS